LAGYGDFATVEKKEVHFGHNIPADYIDRAGGPDPSFLF
jgi:hypothetical protein